MSDAVQQIKDKLDIIDVIAPYVELTKAGKNYKGKSPFSAEKTPSFYVSPDRGMYYCFSTNQGGDMFTFIEAMEGVDFKGALTQLAVKAGVELVPEDPQKRSERDRWYAALDAAVSWYQTELQQNKTALEYLEQRGVAVETIAAWRIGYAPGPPARGWREAKAALEGQGYTTDELLAVGLIKTTEGGKEPFDVFRDRIVFPMNDSSGRPVAFSGRILSPDSEAPKYVNSPETALYKKSELLFGYDKAKQGIRTFDFSLIVEGQFDVVMSHQAGYTNTVAVSGTALTPQHVDILQRLSDKVVLALDADRAGIAAMKKAAELMLGRGMDVKVAPLPDGQDPADIIAQDVAAFKKVIGSSVTVVEYLTRHIQKEASDQRRVLTDVKAEVYPLANLAPSTSERYAFAQLIASVLQVPVDVVWRDMELLYGERAEITNSGAGSVIPTLTTLGVMPETFLARLRAFAYFLNKTNTDTLINTIEEILLDTELDEPDVSLVAETTQRFETHYENLPQLTLLEDIVSDMNNLRKHVAEKRLREYRALQSESDDEQLSQQILVWAGQKSAMPFTTEIFVKQG